MQQIRVGIVGISGYGGGEALRYIARHPHFKLCYAAGESTAGSTVGERYPGVPDEIGCIVIDRFDPASINHADVLFTSLPTGASKEPLALIGRTTKIVDIGGDHRYVNGWTYGLADIWPQQIVGKTRIANPGCYPSAALTAIAPLLAAGMIDLNVPIIIDAKSGVSGAGRGGGGSFGYADTNEDLMAYGLFKHAHLPEMRSTISALAANAPNPRVVFTPHLIPMTRGILATCYLSGAATTAQCMEAARAYYKDRPFVKVVDKPPHTKWATGTNLVYISYAADAAGGPIIALAAIDNLGKGAAGQAIQNANLICGLPAETGLSMAPLWP